MASDLTRKKSCSSTAIIHVTFLFLMIITLMASFTWLENHLQYTSRGIHSLKFHSTNSNYVLSQISYSDHDHHTKLMLEMAPDPNPNPNPNSPMMAGIACDRTHGLYDLCLVNGPTNVTLHTIGPTSSLEKVKPYPRKWEFKTMAKIRDVTLETGPIGPKCEVHHNSPALVFSAGGFTGNFFHDVNDGLLPLYNTLTNLLMVDRDVILVVDNALDWWVHKYADIIRAFTKHPVIKLQNENSTHCFPRAYAGLISHWYITVDQKALPNPITISQFHTFIKNALYSHEVRPTSLNRRPKLIWLVRAGSAGRVILNQDKARAVAEEIGFDVTFYHPTKTFPLRKAYNLINRSHAMIGVHGAAFTHILFLRKGSVVVQVVPLGLELVAKVSFEPVARGVELEYMEYKINYNESSLSRKYEKENPIIKDAESMLEEKRWDEETVDVYLKKQDVRLDLVKFRVCMENVYKKAKQFKSIFPKSSEFGISTFIKLFSNEL